MNFVLIGDVVDWRKFGSKDLLALLRWLTEKLPFGEKVARIEHNGLEKFADGQRQVDGEVGGQTSAAVGERQIHEGLRRIVSLACDLHRLPGLSTWVQHRRRDGNHLQFKVMSRCEAAR